MDQPLSLNELVGLCVALIAIVGALAGAWWFLFNNILAVRRELHEFRLKVAEDYASREHLKELELRLVAEFKDLKQEFHDMPERFAAVMKSAKSD